MTPDFKKATIETLAKRAAYKCSNPDCRINTTGPNSDPTKSTTIGEAAHIRGARPGSKRYIKNMTDSMRAEITNGIWLCGNCHKLIDTDEVLYSSEILFKWREDHDEYILSQLGNTTDKIIYQEKHKILTEFKNYPSLIKRIIIDKPLGWEYRLTGELMKYLNKPHFRRLEDLKDNLYLKEIITVKDEDALDWIQNKLTEAHEVIQPVHGLFEKMNKSFGEGGIEGDLQEIHHITLLISEYLKQIILFEEKIRFIIIPKEYTKLVQLLRNIVGTQVKKLESIPDRLENFLSLINEENIEQTIIKEEIIFDLPENWEEDFIAELKKLENHKLGIHSSTISKNKGCITLLVIFLVMLIFLFF